MLKRATLNVFNRGEYILFRATNLPLLPVGSELQITTSKEEVVVELESLQITAYFCSNIDGTRVHLKFDSLADSWQAAWDNAEPGDTQDYRIWPEIIDFSIAL